MRTSGRHMCSNSSCVKSSCSQKQTPKTSSRLRIGHQTSIHSYLNMARLRLCPRCCPHQNGLAMRLNIYRLTSQNCQHNKHRFHTSLQSHIEMVNSDDLRSNGRTTNTFPYDRRLHRRRHCHRSRYEWRTGCL